VPPGIKLIRVDAKTGQRVGPSAGGKVILEAFKPGTAPPDNYSVVGNEQQDGYQGGGYQGGYQSGYPGGSMGASPDAERAVRRGSGLY